MVTPEEMAKRKKQRPFRPFRVVMRNGESFEVLHDLDYMPLRDRIHLPTGDRVDGIPKRGVFRHYEDIERLVPLEGTTRGAA